MDKPKLLSLRDADRLRANSDPYRVVQRMLLQKDYDGLSAILKREAPARHTAAIPTLLLHASNAVIRAFYEGVRKRGAVTELVYCAAIAKGYVDKCRSELEKLASQYTGEQGALTGFPQEEFDHFFQVYNYASRSTRS